MEWVETTGRTVAEALDAALDQLGVDEQDAEVQIVEEPQKGLFGRLRSEARVRARVRPTRPRPKAERRDRRKRGDRDRERRGRSGGTGGGSGSGGGGAATTKVTAAGQDSDGSNGASEDQPAEDGNGTTDGSRKRRRRRGNRPKQQGATVTNVRDESATTETGLDLDAQKAAVEEFLKGLVDALGRPEAKVTVAVVEDETLEAEIEGDELGLLVGPKGLTLQALHELVRSMVQRRFVGQAHARVRVDVGGYRARRREALERFTTKVIDEVLESGEAKRLEPMAASDRKVVHDTANDVAGVRTISEGEEPARRVVILPE